MKKTKVVVLGLMVALAAAFTGCKGKATENGTKIGSEKAPGWTLNAKTPIKFDWYINFSWFARHWGDSQVSKYITQKTGVDINFVVPAGNEAEKLNAMIAGDALPDIITRGWYEGQIPMMIDAGLVEPLDELAKEY